MDRIDKSSLGRLSPISDGGQGLIFRVLGIQPKVNGSAVRLVYKEYKPQTRNSLNVSALTQLASFRDGLSPADRQRLVSRTALPLHLITENGAVMGFTMIEVPAQFSHVMTFRRGASTTLGEVQHLLQNDNLLTARGLPITDRLRLEFLRDVAETLDFFHRHQLAVGDFSAKNLLFRLSGKTRCFFLDCDSMILGGRAALPLVETPEWDVPNHEAPGTLQGDLYKLGLLAVRLFAGDQRTRSPGQAPRLPAAVRRLAERSLAGDPTRRPQAEEWLAPLAKEIPKASTKLPKATIATSAAPTPPRLQPPPMPTPRFQPPPTPVPPATATAPVRPAVTPPRRKRRGVLWASIVALALVAGVAVYALAQSRPRNSATAASALAVRSQAAAVNNVLAASGRSRSELVAALRAAERCSRLGHDIKRIEAAVRQRTAELQRAAVLQTGSLPNGAALKSGLTSAIRYSAQADRDFLAWVRQVHRSGCYGSARITSRYRAAMKASVRATRAKMAFLRQWNPVATEQGLPTRRESRL